MIFIKKSPLAPTEITYEVKCFLMIANSSKPEKIRWVPMRKSRNEFGESLYPTSFEYNPKVSATLRMVISMLFATFAVTKYSLLRHMSLYLKPFSTEV